MGLTVNYSPAPGSEVIAGQVKGHYDITGNNYVSYIEAQLNHQADLPKSPIQTLAQLRGHARSRC